MSSSRIARVAAILGSTPKTQDVIRWSPHLIKPGKNNPDFLSIGNTVEAHRRSIADLGKENVQRLCRYVMKKDTIFMEKKLSDLRWASIDLTTHVNAILKKYTGIEDVRHDEAYRWAMSLKDVHFDLLPKVFEMAMLICEMFELDKRYLATSVDAVMVSLRMKESVKKQITTDGKQEAMASELAQLAWNPESLLIAMEKDMQRFRSSNIAPPFSSPLSASYHHAKHTGDVAAELKRQGVRFDEEGDLYLDVATKYLFRSENVTDVHVTQNGNQVKTTWEKGLLFGVTVADISALDISRTNPAYPTFFETKKIATMYGRKKRGAHH